MKNSLSEYTNIPQTAEMIIKQSKGLIPSDQIDLVSQKLNELITLRFSSNKKSSV
jgi:hypothetical protein